MGVLKLLAARRLRGAWGVAVDQESIDYFRSRERIERDAAKSAESEQARRAHLALAHGYAALVRRG